MPRMEVLDTTFTTPPPGNNLEAFREGSGENFTFRGENGENFTYMQGGLTEEGCAISAVFLGLIGFFGVFNNMAVLTVMAMNKQLRTPLNALLINLAISDLGISIVGCPLSLIASVSRGWTFGSTACVGYAFLMSLFGITSITTLTALSFERFLIITRPWKTSELTHGGARLIIAGVWTYSALTTTPPLYGWGGFGVEGPGISCSVDWETRSLTNTSYIMFLFLFGLFLPLAVMFFSYSNIIITLKQHGDCGLQARVARSEKRIAAMVFIMILTFLMAWSPYAVMSCIMAFGDPNYVTPEAAVVPAVFAKSSCLYNPIIYVGLNTQFRTAWWRLLCCKDRWEDEKRLAQPTEKVSLTIFTENSPQNRRITKSSQPSHISLYTNSSSEGEKEEREEQTEGWKDGEKVGRKVREKKERRRKSGEKEGKKKGERLQVIRLNTMRVKVTKKKGVRSEVV